jgi:polysaccharide export outer membrane protein
MAVSARWRRAIMGCCLAGLITGCASTGGAIPIEQFVDAQPGGDEYIIEPEDGLVVQVFEQEKMSGKMRVRSDGRITLPLVNEIQAAGKTPTALAADIEGALKAFILNPRVTVVVEEQSPLRISVLGEVASQGPRELKRGAGVAQALAAAGGLSTFADRDKIFVVRNEPKPVRIHFTYDAITRGVGRAATFRLRTGDVIVVE